MKSSNISIKKYASGGPLSYSNGISINYPGTKSSSIMAQIELDNESSGSTYLNHTAAIEEVQFLAANISQGQKKHTLFAGMDIGESKLLIGGNQKVKQRFPLSISDNGTIGSFSTGTVNGITGMSAFAYSGQDFDQYFFSDIYTRRYNLHNSKSNYQSEFADFSNDSQYPDGEYNLAVRLIKKN